MAQRAGRRRCLHPGNQGATAAAGGRRHLFSLCPQPLSRRGKEGLQRRRLVPETPAAGGAARHRLGGNRQRRPLSGGALPRFFAHQPLHAQRHQRRGASSQKRSLHGETGAVAECAGGGGRAPHPLRRHQHRPHRKRPEKLEGQPEKQRFPAARARVADRFVRRRIPRRLPPRPPRRRAIHLVEPTRQRARQ